jgi:hypothetical protein
MTTTSFARINDTARIHCVGALDGMIRLEIFNVVKDFLARTNAWLMELPVYVIPTTNDYIIDTCQPSTVVTRLMQLTRPDDVAFFSNYVPGCPPQYLQSNPSNGVESMNPLLRSSRDGVLLNAGTKCPVLRIRWNPQVNETWIATLALNITDPTDEDGLPCSPPDWLIEKYNSVLSDGVVSKLMLQAGKPYSSPQGAEYHGRKFNQGVGTARTEVRDMFVFGGQRWYFPTGWKTRVARRNG